MGQFQNQCRSSWHFLAASGHALSAELNSNDVGSRLKQLLSDPKVPKTIHDLKSAMHVFAERDLQLEGVHQDPMLYSYLLDPTYSSHRLPEVALRRFNLKLSGTLPEAADVTGRLTAALRQEVAESDLTKVYDQIDLPLLPVLFRMEHAGVKIDCDVLAEMSQRLQLQVDEKARDIYDKAGVKFNINSPRQLGDVLFNQLNLPKPVKYGKGKTISTAVDVLENLAAEHEVPRLVLEYRQFSKLKSTYVDALPVLCRKNTGRLHTTFDQTNAATGRLSSRNPNLQNIPIRTELGREIRAAFVAEEGCVLLAADYSQIELRLLAHFSEDKLLVDAFRRGDDIHTLTASQVFGVPPLMIDAEHRRRAKAVNFGIVYGLSAFGLSQQIGIEPREAKQFIDAYFEKYSGVRRFIDSTLEQARRDGKVFTLFGRVRPIPDINGKNANLARIRRAHRRQHAVAGNRRRPDQARHDPHRSRASDARTEIAHDAAGPRRTCLRSSRRRSRDHSSACTTRNGKRSSLAGSAAGRNWRRQKLAGYGIIPRRIDKCDP